MNCSLQNAINATYQQYNNMRQWNKNKNKHKTQEIIEIFAPHCTPQIKGGKIRNKMRHACDWHTIKMNKKKKNKRLNNNNNMQVMYKKYNNSNFFLLLLISGVYC